LFNGDASTHNELALLQKFPNLKADILKVGHHGSDTSTDELFLKEVNPKYALISAGLNNSYEHPTLNVIERLQKHDIDIFIINLDADIEYKTNEKTEVANFNKIIK